MNEHYFVFHYRGKEYKLRSTSEQLAVIFGMPQMEGRGKEEHLTKLDKTYSRSEFYITYFGSSGVIRKVLLENNIVRLVKSGEKNEDLVKLIELFMCKTLFFTAREASRLNEKYLKLFDSPKKTNSLSWPDLIHDHLMASINEHKDKDTSQVTGCIWFAEHIKSGIEKTPIVEGLPRLARWNLHDISSAIETDFMGLTDFEHTSAKRSQPDTLGVGSSSEDTEDVEIPNVDDALQNLDTSTTSGDMGLNEKDIVNPAKGDAFIPPVHCSANPPVATSVASLPEGDATRVIEETTAPTTPFVNSSILDSEASDGLHSTIGCAPPPCLADMESYVREYDNESALSSLYLFYHTESKYRADAALAKQIEATNGVQEQLTSPITRIQELESLNQDKARQQADLQLQLEGIREQLAVANAHIQEVESLNQAQALQHADVQFQLEGNVESLKSQLKRAKQYYGKWAKDQVNQAFDLAESSGMMKPGEKFKRY
ncbi:hypothetical protein C5167_040490 [Papaver somniferum]|uniref:DUF1985 domain-containing protein n=1 Tax=Papaver somniferum TaxID=3469 RepID=A0A4Y7IJB3_PAPSO|nr:hypothetical protein C5167_040490 [Papaver somniferum]